MRFNQVKMVPIGQAAVLCVLMGTSAACTATPTEPLCEVSMAGDQTVPQSLTELTEQIPTWLDESETPSVSAALVEQGEVQWAFACGTQSPKAPATLQTRYNTASISKPVIGELVLRLADQGELSLDEPMADHWVDPDIAGDPNTPLLTPRLALAHQTGFANWRHMTEGVLTFRWAPGEQVGYSGEGISYVARFLENKFEQPFENLADDILFAPEEMEDSDFVFTDAIETLAAHRWRGERGWGEPNRNAEPLGAHLWITAADYARFIAAVVADETTAGETSARSTIQRDDVERMCGPDKRRPLELCADQMGFGVGWYVYQFGDRRFLGHTGANTGERSLAVMEPAAGSGLVVFANGETGNEVISKVARFVYPEHPVLDLEGL